MLPPKPLRLWRLKTTACTTCLVARLKLIIISGWTAIKTLWGNRATSILNRVVKWNVKIVIIVNYDFANNTIQILVSGAIATKPYFIFKKVANYFIQYFLKKWSIETGF